MSRLWIGSGPLILADHDVLVAVSPPGLEGLDSLLRSVGVSPQRTSSVEEAVHALEFHQPEFVILSEKFGSNDLHSNPFLDYIQKLPAQGRRGLFVIFIGSKIRSGDLLSAFSYSVNLVLHPHDLPELVEYINKSWNTWKELYRVYFQTRLQISCNTP